VSGCGFSYGHYRETLLAALARYAFVSFPTARSAEAPERFIVLRHDVDYALEDALILAELEAALGVFSTFFVLPHAHYNPLGGTGFGMLRRIVGLGHSLGVHYDARFYAANGLPAAKTLRHEADRFSAVFETPVRVVAAHKPGRGAHPPVDLTGLIDAYDPELATGIKYVSDSCQFWREGCFCQAVGGADFPRLQVLVHPEWWTEEGTPADVLLDRWAERRAQEARADCQAEFRDFAGLEHLGNRYLFDRRGG
jgi:hypothetical protein